MSVVFTDLKVFPERLGLTALISRDYTAHERVTRFLRRSRGVWSVTENGTVAVGGGVQQERAEMFGGFF